MNVFGSASPWEKSPFSKKLMLGQGEVPEGYEPAIPEGDSIRVNGGRLERAIGFLWFFPDPDVMDKIEAFTGERPSESIEAHITWCNPTPPISATLGGFSDPETGKYCQIDLPKEWQCATTSPWLCDESSEVEEGMEAVPYDPVGTPPYWGEWGAQGAGCGKVGPFDTIEEAFNAAADAASEHGATSLPGDGWAQVKDSEGRGVGPIT